MKKIGIYLILSLVLISSCKKEEEEETAEQGDAPVLTFVSISPSTATELVDEITLTISYSDINGDLGENSADVKNLYVLDTRNSVEYSFRVQQLAPDNANIHIEGNLNINLGTMVITNGSASESATFQVYMYDRAGNKSNVITTSAITVVQ